MDFLTNNTLFSIALIVLGFGFLIFVHELGHFLVAKMVGIKATQFAIGFGNAIITWRKGIGFRTGSTEPEYEKRIQQAFEDQQSQTVEPKEKVGDLSTEQVDRIAASLGLGETEYRINYIPLGGYVKMVGQEDMDPSARSSDPRAFNNKSISARFAVISAGVIMNLIFGVIFFVIAFMSGVKFPPAIVGNVAAQTPAAFAYAQGHEGEIDYQGLRIGDRITHVDGVEVGDMMDVKYATILAHGGSPIDMVIQRQDEAKALTYRIVPEVDQTIQLLSSGIDAPLSLEVSEVDPGSDLEKAGVTKGMRITAVDGQAVDGYVAYHRAVTAARGKQVSVTLTDPKTGKTAETTVSAAPRLTQQQDVSPNLLGLVPPVRFALVEAKSPAAAAGIKEGDLVAALGGQSWPDEKTLRQTIKSAEDKPVEVTVMRDGEEIVIGPVTPKDGKLGIYPDYQTDAALIGRTLPGSFLGSPSPIVGGSKLLSINGEPVGSWADLQRVLGSLQAGGGAEVTLEYELNMAGRPREQTTVTLGPETVSGLAYNGWAAPLPEGMKVLTLQEPVVGDDPIKAAALGVKKTHQFITQTYMMLLRLYQGTVPADKLSGPVGIVHQGSIIARRGWGYLLFFLGLISVNLAVINFLPIPITDGGHAIFLIAEKVKGSPVSVRVQTTATVVGLALLGCVFLYVTYHDIVRLIPKP